MENFPEKIRHSQSGFSLLEMIIAVTVFLIVMGAVYGLLAIGNISRSTINNRSETITNARAAVNSIGKDVVNAGLGYSRVGGVVPDDFINRHLFTAKDSDNQRDLLTAIIAGNNLRQSDLSVNGQKNDAIAFAFRDLHFNGGNSINIIDAPLSAIVDNSVVLKTQANGCVNCRPYDLYLIETTDGKQAVVMATDIPDSETIVLGRNDPLELNQPVIHLDINQRSMLTKCVSINNSNCIDYTSGVTAKKIYWVSFSIDVNGTLIRTTYGNNAGATATEQIQKQPIAHGVQNFQVRYLMQDGSVTDDPSQDNQFPMKMNEVVQVEITMTIKSGNGSGTTTNTDLINVTSTFSTRNLKYGLQ